MLYTMIPTQIEITCFFPLMFLFLIALVFSNVMWVKTEILS